MSYAPSDLTLPVDIHLQVLDDALEINPRLLGDALLNQGNGLITLDDETATRGAQQLEAIRSATDHVWNQLMLPAFGQLVSAGRVKLYARVQSRVAQFQHLPGDLYLKLKHWGNWQDGTACDPEGVCYYSIHAADSLPKASPMQASTIAVEKAATNALVGELKRNLNLSRKQAGVWLMTNGYPFPETGRPFLQRIWPEARDKAELPKLAPSGRKKSTP